MRLLIMNGAERISTPPAIDSVTVKVSAHDATNVLVCDVWRCGDIVAAKPTATLSPAEIPLPDLAASLVCEITHKYTMLKVCEIGVAFPLKAFRAAKEVPSECIL